MRNVLVLGGAGFIGSHLCRRLLGENCRVTAFTRSLTKKRNIEALLTHPHFTLVEQDIRTPFHHDAEEIYHLASPASPKDCDVDPAGTVTTNILGTLNALTLANKTGAKLLLASTSEIYGVPSVVPQPENYWGNADPIGPRGFYYEAKRCAEALVFDSYRRHKTPVKIARIFNVYGPHADPYDGRVISNFIVQALKGQAITLHGEGKQLRSFCYIDDLIEALVRVMQTDGSVTGPINLGSPEPFTIREVAEQIRSITGSRSDIISVPGAQNPPYLCPDIALARSTLKWSPRVPLAEGLTKTIAYFRNIAAI